ncbi:MAG: preprotein translocase subunit SecG [Candidatus Peregrinibacteria bacterium]|nr:preprotein translocase subunit SecG [Candidatus Peregrinibacteria bacterium]
MKEIILIIQLVVSILLTILILAQNKDGGLSAVMGGGQSFQSVKRGAEKVIHRATVALAVIFLLNALLIVFV